MRVPPQWQIHEICKSRTAAPDVDLALGGVATDNLRGFKIEKMRRMQRLKRGEQNVFYAFRRRRTEKDLKQDRSVHDDHARSRSAQIASAGGGEGSVFVRLFKRARSSPIVGRSAA